jgi:hypothetical protein
MKQPLHKLEEGGTNDGNMADQGDDGSPNPTKDLRSENHSDNQRHHNSYNVTYYYVSIQLSHQKYYQPITSRIPNLQEHSYFFGVFFKHVKRMARFTQPQIIIEFYEANAQRTDDHKE